MSINVGRSMGWARAAVGVALVVAPRRSLRLSGREEPTAVSTLLLRTIGIRDLVLGCGTLMAARRGPEDLKRWTSMGLASDSLDVVAGLSARRAIGTVESLGATAAALVFALGDLAALRGLVDDGALRPAEEHVA